MITRLAGPPPTVDGRTLDPAMNLILAFERWGVAGRPTESVDQRRENLRKSAALVMPSVGGVWVNERLIPGPAGELRVRVYRGHRTRNPAPVIVYYHGGGWVSGDLDTHDGSCRMLALHSGCHVVSVDYRRAPEHPFPAAFEDALAAFRFVHDNPRLFCGLPGAVAVMGDSAGGNLAATVSIATRDQGPRPVAQCLVYPATDARMQSDSLETFATGFFLSKKDMYWFRNHYLPDTSAITDTRVSPLLEQDLSGLPPALLWMAGFDPLRDEGFAYARRLEQAGVPVTTRCADGLIHGFFGIGISPTGMKTIATVSRQAGALVRGALARTAGPGATPEAPEADTLGRGSTERILS